MQDIGSPTLDTAPSVNRSLDRVIEILEAATVCISKNGIENTTFERIAHVINKRASHVKYYFDDKHNLFQSAVEYVTKKFQTEITAELAKIADPRSKVIRYGEFYPDFYDRYPHYRATFALIHYYMVQDKSLHPIGESIRTFSIERIARLLSETYPDLSWRIVKDRAEFLFTLMQGLCFQYFSFAHLYEIDVWRAKAARYVEAILCHLEQMNQGQAGAEVAE